jgi:hypothetical protein
LVFVLLCYFVHFYFEKLLQCADKCQPVCDIVLLELVQPGTGLMGISYIPLQV